MSVKVGQTVYCCVDPGDEHGAPRVSVPAIVAGNVRELHAEDFQRKKSEDPAAFAARKAQLLKDFAFKENVETGSAELHSGTWADLFVFDATTGKADFAKQVYFGRGKGEFDLEV